MKKATITKYVTSDGKEGKNEKDAESFETPLAAQVRVESLREFIRYRVDLLPYADDAEAAQARDEICHMENQIRTIKANFPEVV